MSSRIIIGEGERAGLPISVPTAEDNGVQTTMRWRNRGDSFVLEQWTLGRWIEIPCVETARDDKNLSTP